MNCHFPTLLVFRLRLIILRRSNPKQRVRRRGNPRWSWLIFEEEEEEEHI